jgi:hypothetical protein
MDSERARTEKNIGNLSSIKYKFKRCPCKMHGGMSAGARYHMLFISNW